MTKRLTLAATKIAGIMVIERQQQSDDRGSFTRLFCAEEMFEAGWLSPVAQINYTTTVKAGTVRGMHLQIGIDAEMKLVMCVRGAVCDVGIDLRKSSATLLAYHCELLSADNRRALLIPEGCAHGFQALTDDVHMLYLHSRPYNAEAERGISPLDPAFAFKWPQPITVISQRDQNHPPLPANFEGYIA